MRFRKRPVEVEAVQFTGDNADEIERFAGDAYETWLPSVGKVAIRTLEGEMTASPGDWIIREPFPTNDRQFYPCKPDIFEATYEPVESAADALTAVVGALGGERTPLASRLSAL